MAIVKHLNFSLDLMHSNNFFNVSIYIRVLEFLLCKIKLSKLSSGNLFVMPPDIKHSVKIDEGSICIYVMIRRKYINSVFF